MKRSSKLGLAAGLCLLLVAGVVVLDLYRRPDPHGESHRDPTLMHAHQGEWPAACRDARHMKQSPIAIPSGNFGGKPTVPIDPKFVDAEASLVDVGHTFQVRFPGSGGTLEFEGKRYNLKQFHFHKPSEHVVDGKQYEMEVHIVFIEDAPDAPHVFVLGFPIHRGAANQELAKVWQYLPPIREGYGEDAHEGRDWEAAIATHELRTESLGHGEKELKAKIGFNVGRMIPGTANLLIYEGSLTTPSCDENVTHAFSLATVDMDDQQVEHFEGYYEGSNRDIQPVGDPAARNFRRGSLNVSGP